MRDFFCGGNLYLISLIFLFWWVDSSLVCEKWSVAPVCFTDSSDSIDSMLQFATSTRPPLKLFEDFVAGSRYLIINYIPQFTVFVIN